MSLPNLQVTPPGGRPARVGRGAGGRLGLEGPGPEEMEALPVISQCTSMVASGSGTQLEAPSR
eukprot:468424-Rhodomonas_salina.1